MRAAKRLLIAAVACVLFASAAVHLFLDAALKAAAERAAPGLLGAPFKLGSVGVSLLTGTVTLRGLEIGSPQGFRAPFLLKADRIYVRVDPSSALSDTLVVREVAVDRPEIVYELGLSGSNVARLQRSLESAAPAPAPAKPAGKARKVIIDRASVTGGKVRLATQLLGGGELPALPLPDVRLTGIGRRSGGATAAQALAELAAPITQAVGRAAASGGRGVADGVNSALKSLLGRARK